MIDYILIHLGIDRENVIFGQTADFEFESVIKLHHIFLLHAAEIQYLGIIHNMVKHTAVLEHIQRTGPVEIAADDFQIIIVGDPDGFQIAYIVIILGDFIPGVSFG